MSKIFTSFISGDMTHTGDYEEIPGMTLEVPAFSSSAAIIFNLPQPYAEGSNYPGGAFRIMFNGNIAVEGCFTYSQQQPQSFGRMPLTLTSVVSLLNLPPGQPLHRFKVEWSEIRGSKVHIGGSASLIVIVE